MDMDAHKKALIHRLLVFWLSEKVTDPEYVLNSVATEARATPEEVWAVYCEMLNITPL